MSDQPVAVVTGANSGIGRATAVHLAQQGMRVFGTVRAAAKAEKLLAIFAKNIDAPNSTGAYDAAYRHMFQFYAAGMANATDPFEVGKVIHGAITTDTPVLRYPVSWAGDEMAGLHDRIDDADWLELGTIADDDAYNTRFEEIFGIDIRTA